MRATARQPALALPECHALGQTLSVQPLPPIAGANLSRSVSPSPLPL